MPVEYLSPVNASFEAAYIALRKQEGRVYSDEEVRTLPYLKEKHAEEWALRVKTAERFKAYLITHTQPKKVLDIGCGNGWFSHFIAKITPAKVDALDVNEAELQQADRIFTNENLRFYYADIFEIAPDKGYDIITVNACIQYFPDLGKIIQCLKNLLSPSGEIHILDSPFYPDQEIEAARQRTKTYYSKAGFPEMAEYYHHHSTSQMITLGGAFLYKPSTGILRRFKKDSPFPWIKISSDEKA